MSTHHPSFTRPVQAAFYARIAQEDIRMKGDPLAVACESVDWPRPSGMTPAQRERLLRTLTCGGFPAIVMTLRRILEHRYRVAEEAEMLDQIAYNKGFDAGYWSRDDEVKHAAKLRQQSNPSQRDHEANKRGAEETV